MLSADFYVLPRSAAGLPAKSGRLLPKQTNNKQTDMPPPLEGRGKFADKPRQSANFDFDFGPRGRQGFPLANKVLLLKERQ